MSTKTNSSENVIKERIQGAQQSTSLKELLKSTIEQSLAKDLEKTGLSERQLLGFLVHPFCGSATVNFNHLDIEKVLPELMIHFSNPDNLSDLPEEIRHAVPASLLILYKLMKRVYVYCDACFSLGDLHKVENWEDQAGRDKAEMEKWYFGGKYKHLI